MKKTLTLLFLSLATCANLVFAAATLHHPALADADCSQSTECGGTCTASCTGSCSCDGWQTAKECNCACSGGSSSHSSCNPEQ